MTLREALNGGALLCLCLCGVESAAADNQPAAGSGTLTVELTGLTSDEGSVVYAMWNGPDYWLKDNAVREGSVVIENGASRLEFTDLPYGEYAISVFHDKNANNKLDTGFMGIPKEPLGTSNDAKVRFGPPKYKDARFVLDQPDLSISIPIKKLF